MLLALKIVAERLGDAAAHQTRPRWPSLAFSSPTAADPFGEDARLPAHGEATVLSPWQDRVGAIPMAPPTLSDLVRDQRRARNCDRASTRADSDTIIALPKRPRVNSVLDGLKVGEQIGCVLDFGEIALDPGRGRWRHGAAREAFANRRHPCRLALA